MLYVRLGGSVVGKYEVSGLSFVM